MKRQLCVLASVWLLVASSLVQAGRSCEAKEIDELTLNRALAMAAKTQALLDQSGADVVILARTGQDLSRWQIRWSHLAFAYRAPNDVLPVTGIDRSQRRWRVVHKLNECGSETANIYRQGLAQFFLDEPYRYAVTIVVLTRAMEQRLSSLMARSNGYLLMHEARYSAAAYPWSTWYQQSNQWLMETVALASADHIDSRAQAQAWLAEQHYVPSTLRIGTLTRLGARLTSSNIAFDDHPPRQRFRGKITTTTADSVLSWLQETGRATQVIEASL